MKNPIFYTLIFLILFSCGEAEKKESDADKYLTKIRSIYRPLAENHIQIITKAYDAYRNYQNNEKAINESIINELSELMDKQSELVLNAKKELDTIPDDVHGYIQSVRLLIQRHTYGVAPCWELMLANLSYYSHSEQIVFCGSAGSTSLLDTLYISNDIIIDTTEHFGLTQNTSIKNKYGMIGFNGLSIKDYLLHLIEPLEKIEFWEATYCIDNQTALNQDLIKQEVIDMKPIYEIKDSLQKQ